MQVIVSWNREVILYRLCVKEFIHFSDCIRFFPVFIFFLQNMNSLLMIVNDDEDDGGGNND